MKKIVLGIACLATLGFSKDCMIITSPIDLSKMSFGYSNWMGRTVPIVESKTFKYTSFLDAYSKFDESVAKGIKETVCEKNGWDGVVNYKIQWQETDKIYNFIATYDAFEYK